MRKIITAVIAFIFYNSLFIGAVFAGSNNNEVPDGYFVIKSAQAGSSNLGCWDQPGFPKKFKKGTNLATYASDGGIDQKFRFVKTKDGWYNIISQNGGYVDVAGDKNADGTNVLIWEKNNKNNQKFRIKYVGGGRWKIYARNGKVVTLAGQKHDNGTNIHIWTDHNGAWTEWFLVDSKGNTYMPESEEPGTPDFFIKNKKFKYSAGGLVYSSSGTATVKSVNGNKVELEIESVSKVEGPKGLEEKKSRYVITITFKKGIYTYAPSEYYIYTGRVNKDGTMLDFSGEQDGFTLTVIQ